MSTPVGVIKKFVKTLTATKKTGTAAVDEALKAVGATSLKSVESKFELAAEKYSSAKDFLEKACGVRITNTDTGAITGSDAGGKTTKTAESIIPEAAKAKTPTSAQYKSFTTNGLKVNITYNTDEEGASFEKKQKYIASALYNWWIPESLDLINQSLGLNFTDGRANIKTITINIGGADDEYCVTPKIEYDMGLASSVTINISPDIVDGITLNDKNGQFSKSKYAEGWINSDLYDNRTSAYFTNYLDRLILQTMAEVTLKANVPYVQSLPISIRTGLVELVGGYDDASNGYYDFAESDGEFYGYTLMRYLAKNYSDGLPDGITSNKEKTALTVTTEFEGSSLALADVTDFSKKIANVDASAFKKKIKITGNELNNSIVGGSSNDSLSGDAGKDTLSGGKGNDTLTGGKGDDIFIYTAGNDVITDYAAGDKISLSASISNASLKGSDVVFTIGKNTLTVKKAKDKTLTLINSEGKESTTVVSGTKTLNVKNSTESPLTIGADIGTVDASKRTEDIKIVGNKLGNVILGGSKADIIYGEGGNDSILGNAGNDKLYGGLGSDTLKGGAGNDTLIGGAGNDSLWGDEGADVFIYSAGTGDDVIFGFDNKDTLTLDSFDFTASYSSKNKAVTLKFDEGSVTLKDFTATTFNINDEKYKISGSKLAKG